MQLIGQNTILRTVEKDDARFILELRLDPKASKYISKTDWDINKQIEWVDRYKLREYSKEEYYFIIIKKQNGERIGTVRIYDFNQSRCSSGSLLLKRGLPINYFIEVYQICTDFEFEVLGFDECTFANCKFNQKIIDFNTRFGARIIDEDELNVYFLLDKRTFKMNRMKMLNLVNLDLNAVKYEIVNS